jgi:glycosyltransferase involved in cell wall biosynthesis
VTAGNAYLADRAHRAGAGRVEIVPTVVDLEAYNLAPRSEGAIPVVGWIGTPQTWAELARPIHAVLQPVLKAQRATFRAVGAALTPQESDLLDIRPWSEATEVSAIQAMDIGVMPLPDTPWARGKCGYKLIQYMACGLPVVASPVGVNAEIVEHGVNGFLARTEADWREAIETLLKDPDLRARMGAAGRRKVEERYSLQVWGPRVAQLLGSVVGR